MGYSAALWHNAWVMNRMTAPSVKSGPATPARAFFWRCVRVSSFIGAGVAATVALGVLGHGAAYAAKPVVDPLAITVSEFRSIEFGTVAGSSDGPGTAVLSPTGVLTTTGYGIVIKGTTRAGEYKITGPANGTVLITLPTSATLTSGTANATLTNFTSSPSGLGTLNSQGKLSVLVGATLEVPAGMSAGTYDGTFSIFVDLQ